MICHILGTKWSVERKTEQEDRVLSDCGGYTDYTSRRIVVKDVRGLPDVTVSDLPRMERIVIRHEVVHAYLYESGLADDTNHACAWATNEEMVDWIGRQLPKIYATLKELGAEED